MTGRTNTPQSPNLRSRASYHWRFSYYVAITTVGVTAITFAIAILTPPQAGPWCTGDCYEYPYTDVASRFPRDYWWMYPAMLWAVLYVLLVACVHYYAEARKRIFSLLALVLAAIAAAVLLVNYFVQVTVIQPSLLKGETDGIAMLSQYNPHGVFIAMEELGYLLIGVSFAFLAPVFSGPSRLEKTLRWMFTGGFAVTVVALVAITSSYGLSREYRFEVATISIDWLVLIVAGIPLARLFHKTR